MSNLAVVIPSTPAENIPLYICTPRGSSTSLVTDTPDAANSGYPKNLPWLQFLDRDFRVVLKGIEFLPKLRKAATGTLSDHDATQQLLQVVQRPHVVALSNSQKSRLLPTIFQQVVRRCLSITIGCEEMAMQLLARKSVDRLAAQFDMVLPQAYPDENLRRATTLAGGSVAEIQVELLKILLFLLSNRLILDESHYGIDDAQQIVALCQFSGLSRFETLHKMVGLSHKSLTMTAIINALFRAAVLTGAAGFACNLLKADHRLQPDKMIGFRVTYDRINQYRFDPDGTPLEFALTKHYENLVKVFVDAGADLPSYASDDWSLLAVAIYDHFPSTLVQMLRQSGARINGSRFESLHAAFITGNLHLIERLVAQGADLNHRYRGPSVNSEAVRLNPFASSDCFHVLRHVYDVGCLGFAASFHSATITAESNESVDLSESFDQDQDKALELCRLIHDKYRSQMDLSDDCKTADAMILASARGYTKVIEFLHSKFSASVNVLSGYLSPLYAAVGWRQVEAARLLLRLGAYPCPPPAYTVPTPYTHYGPVMGEVECPAPSLLQLAVAQGSCELAELLIRVGVDINEEREIALKTNKLHWPPRAGPSTLNFRHLLMCLYSITNAKLPPFRLAVLSKEWDVGLVLLRGGATATVNDLFDAAVEGQLALVEQLLKTGMDPAIAVREGITAYEAALYKGHVEIAARLATVGGGGSAGDFASVFRIPNVAHIKAHIPPSLLEEPWKMCLDKQRRSYLENAFLSHNEEVIRMALDLDAAAYDSGALCALVSFLTKSGQGSASPLLLELLERRSLDPNSILGNSALENHAVSIAAWHARSDIMAALLASPPSGLTQPLATPAHSEAEFRKTLLDAESTSSESNYDWSQNSPFGLSDKWHGWSQNSPFDLSDNWHVSRFLMVSPLLFAVEGNANEQIADMLLEAGYKPDGFTLRAAITKKLSFGLFERILESCDDVDARCAVDVSWGPDFHDTPLCAAVHRGVDIIRALLARHADINAIRGGFRNTALSEAILYENLPIVNLLLDAGAEVNDPARSITNGFNTTVLQKAAERGLIGLVRRLIDCGADINARRSFNSRCTALEVAAKYGRLDTVRLLLDAGTDTEGYGRVQFVRATGLASDRGHGPVVELLKSHREWSGEDFMIWNQLYPDTKNMVGFDGQPIHPLELPLGELVNELTEIHTGGGLGDRCYAASPGTPDQEVARLIKTRVTEVVKNSDDMTMAVTEEATRFVIGVIRQWSEESGTPLTCSSIWNVEHGAARRPVETCNICGFKAWYYLPCSLRSIRPSWGPQMLSQSLRRVISRSLRQWSPSSLETTYEDGGGTSGELAILPPTETGGSQGSSLENAASRLDEWDDITINYNNIEHRSPDSHDTPTQNSCDDSFAIDSRDGWDEERRAILADMRGEQELTFTPMDCGR